MLQIKGLAKTFNRGTPNEKSALANINLVVDDGDFITMIGGNGAGKSTLLNCVAGVYPPDAGEIRIDEVNVTRWSEYRRAVYLGRVFQDPMMGTAADMTIKENLALARRRGQRRTLRWGVTAGEHEKYREMLGELELGLESRLTGKVGLLSGGQRQALTLLMAILKTPKLLLLDEHTAALDPKTADKVLDLTNRFIQADKLTTMMVTHNMRHALQLGNRLLMMHEGRIVVDVRGEDKRRLKVDDLLQLFERASGRQLDNDRMLLS
ncbi:MAG: ATP-binding cassette domain-containing protein [Oscillospiraceae bacterium]|nr:ATP-binding cassette domain-containing protein [Oscillospiraceae bacterium]